MKKFNIFILLLFILSSTNIVNAHHCHSHYYVTYKDYYQQEYNFNNCDRHTLLEETSVYFYSNGTRRTYKTNTIYDKDGSILENNCSNVKHHIWNNKHYFTYYKNGKYQILSENGEIITNKKYKQMKEIAPNKLLVKLDKKYGIINLNGQVIVPTKYKKFEQIDNNLFLTKLNGYYGILDDSNKILVKNEHDKIETLYNTYLVKKYDKYGLVDKNGKWILPVEYEKIKKLGEYILVKKENKYGILDSDGKIIANCIYKKIRLNRNNLEGKLYKGKWQSL